MRDRGPVIQNLPIRTIAGRQIRDAFLKEAGPIVGADFTDIERRVSAQAACRCGCPSCPQCGVTPLEPGFVHEGP